MGQEDGRSGGEIEFQIIDKGPLSGYSEECYFVVRDATEWAEIWEKHSRILMPKPCPEINFSRNMVICAFMGERPTTGHSISIEEICVEAEKLHVSVVKHHPSPEAIVGQAITYPYVIVSLERLDLEVVFEPKGSSLPEFPTWISMLLLLIVITFSITLYNRKLIKMPIHKRARIIL